MESRQWDKDTCLQGAVLDMLTLKITVTWLKGSVSQLAGLWNICSRWLVYALGEMLSADLAAAYIFVVHWHFSNEWPDGSLHSWWTVSIFNYTWLKLLECSWIFCIIGGLIWGLSVIFQISCDACLCCLPIAASSLAVPQSQVPDYLCDLLLVLLCASFSLCWNMSVANV